MELLVCVNFTSLTPTWSIKVTSCRAIYECMLVLLKGLVLSFEKQWLKVNFGVYL